VSTSIRPPFMVDKTGTSSHSKSHLYFHLPPRQPSIAHHIRLSHQSLIPHQATLQIYRLYTTLAPRTHVNETQSAPSPTGRSLAMQVADLACCPRRTDRRGIASITAGRARFMEIRGDPAWPSRRHHAVASPCHQSTDPNQRSRRRASSAAFCANPVRSRKARPISLLPKRTRPRLLLLPHAMVSSLRNGFYHR